MVLQFRFERGAKLYIAIPRVLRLCEVAHAVSNRLVIFNMTFDLVSDGNLPVKH